MDRIHGIHTVEAMARLTLCLLTELNAAHNHCLLVHQVYTLIACGPDGVLLYFILICSGQKQSSFSVRNEPWFILSEQLLPCAAASFRHTMGARNAAPCFL